ncbi:putative arginine--tRNA ligase, cytoplasmic [Aphelenchoides fujianensis]|nr:putative arginine--tRNA ligase, cytoplasmic [Aphelenchoides fujianensis]
MAATNPEVPSEVGGLNRKYAEVTKRLELLETLSADIAAGRLSEQLRAECPELAKKTADVEKLRYRAGIMKRRIAELDGAEKKKSPPKEQKPPAVKYVRVSWTMGTRSSSVWSPSSGRPSRRWVLRETDNLKFGDYQFDSCPLIAKKLADAGVRLSPAEVAARLMAALPPVDLVARVEGAKFFINVFLEPRVVGQRGVAMPELERRVVCIDFSSPNIAKQMHVGHLRSTIIGESMARLLEFVGYDVRRINHIGDWGTQFGMLIAHLQDRFPNFARETPPLADLQAFYKESKKRFDEDEAFKKRAYECVVRLQNHDPEFIAAWKLICDVSRADFQEIYRRLDVRIEERGESFYQERMKGVVQLLEERKLLVEEEGRKLFFPDGAPLPLTVVKSDGGFTYDTSDLATIQHRLFEERAEWLLYVVDAGQAAHFETIFAAARHLGWPSRTAAFGRAGQRLRVLLRPDARRPRQHGREPLYAHARICSIIRTAGVDPQRTADYVDALPDGVLPLDHPAELKLAKQLLRLSDVLLVVLESLQLHKLCDYVYQLATMFADFYKECYVVEKREDGPHVNFHRLVLCEVTAQVMRTCFKILGIRPLEKM